MFTKEWYKNNLHPKGMLGKKHKLETIKKISQHNAKFNLGKRLSKETKEKISRYHIGKRMSDETKLKISLKKKGVKKTNETRTRMSEGRKMYLSKHPEVIEQMRIRRTGSNNPNWNGGSSKIHDLIRATNRYKRWRKEVFEKFNYTCVMCGGRNVYLHVDHFPVSLGEIIMYCKIKNLPDAHACEILWDVNNGRVLCVPCHRKTPTYAKNTRKVVLSN